MTESNIQTYENDHITLKVEKLPGCLVKFDLTTKPLATKAAKEKALKEITKEVSLPGFRKGKAPKDLVLKQFGQQIAREEKEVITRNSLSEAVKLTHLRPFNQDTQVHLHKCEALDAEHYNISFEFEAFPEVPPVDLSSLKLQAIESQPVSEEELTERLDELRLYHASWEEITDRAAAEGDFVTIDMDVIDGTPQQIYRDRRFKLADKGLPKWAQKLIIGLNLGDSAEGFSEQDDGGLPQADFEPKKVRMTVKKIEKAILPNLDDELAKKAGVSTADELKKAITSSLEKEQQNKIQQEMRMAARNLLVERYSFELPGSRVKQVREDVEDETAGEKEHFKTEEALNHYKELLLKNHLDSVKLSFILPSIIRDQKISRPTVARLRERVMGYILSRQIDAQKLKQEDLEYLMRMAENDLLTEDALDFVVSKATENS